MLWRIFSLLIAFISLAGSPARADGLNPGDTGQRAAQAQAGKPSQVCNEGDCEAQAIAPRQN